MHMIETLAEFVAGHREGALPSSTRQMTAKLVADLIAASIGGSKTILARSARDAACAAYGSDGGATIWLTPYRTSLVGAALANAAAASALDIDDGHRGAAGHPGAGVIPAALAVAEAVSAPDDAIFDAIALGYDVALRIATSRPKGSFPTYASGLWVGFGAAACTGRLLGLDAARLAHALAIVAAERPVSYPTGTTRYHGNSVKEAIPAAVVAGITAAYRARSGASGPLDLLDGPERYQPDLLLSGLGETWWIDACYLKPYACCRYMHGAIDAILALRRPDQPIVSLEIETFAQGLKLSNARQPANLEAGQYSYYFSCALAAVRGLSALQPVDPASLSDPAVLELAQRITLSAHDDFAASFPEATPCRVRLDQGDGPEVLTAWQPKGDVGNPMSSDEVIAKLHRLADRVLPAERTAQITSALMTLGEGGFRPLLAALRLPR